MAAAPSPAVPTPAESAAWLQDVVDAQVADAAGQGIRQSVAVVDRATGALLADNGGRRQYISESIVKLFTVAYYLVRADGHPDPELAQRLRTMIVASDDAIESSLWSTEIVPAMAARYGLGDTGNGPRTGPDDWGWELITADDEAVFLDRMSQDPLVAPLLMDAMADVRPMGADGFDQDFGLDALPGDHGSKQGWTDIGAGPPIQVHSVGWTDRFYVAILQTSDTADDDTMRAAATATAAAIRAAGEGAGGGWPAVGRQVAATTRALAGALIGGPSGR
ncbi:hypothetical protein [Nakamurella sp.]|uniref:hypothetical protein n=1 Tax=Nakamurella sp. TaxID=1869182 RepID=UPI003B3AE896